MKMIPLMAALMVMAGAILPAGASTMDAYRWKNRVLVLFAGMDDAQVDEQRQILMPHEDGLADRDMVIFAVVEDGILPVYGQAPAAGEAAALRAEFGVQPGSPFTALLVGKDGGVKWRENRPAAQHELFGLIDSMPMRRNER
ncbi:MAG TPA: DUF4174 domain-containing protein [Geminicoccus sp.]|jgi:hypothetical protein|uniref:DUF4174 domain-containing protein n=1 Tax=Geminicoccus sp. TaxID=2024832 RepID=UPI002E2F70BB|nr:DUF4174 domain-containing protein [Geminicoccus sp.]HEX2528456.1 DUF4174 domain-containing protein [Geminicoccus sp.]